MKKLALILLIVTPISACASSLSLERRDYILSREHGFIEISISDAAIPKVIQRHDKDRELVKPEACSLTVEANSEPFFSQAVFPDGAEPPFNVTSGFRFPVPVGAYKLKVTYAGCRVNEKGEADEITVFTDIAVQNDKVYDVQFSNGQIVNVIEKANEEVTLKQVLEAIKK